MLSYERGVVQVGVSMNGRTVNIFSTHVDYYNSSYRTTQINQAKSWISGFSQSAYRDGRLQHVVRGRATTTSWPARMPMRGRSGRAPESRRPTTATGGTHGGVTVRLHLLLQGERARAQERQGARHACKRRVSLRPRPGRRSVRGELTRSRASAHTRGLSGPRVCVRPPSTSAAASSRAARGGVTMSRRRLAAATCDSASATNCAHVVLQRELRARGVPDRRPPTESASLSRFSSTDSTTSAHSAGPADGGIKSPPAPTASRNPPTSRTMHGMPLDCASTTTRPNGSSHCEGDEQQLRVAVDRPHVWQPPGRRSRSAGTPAAPRKSSSAPLVRRSTSTTWNRRCGSRAATSRTVSTPLIAIGLKKVTNPGSRRAVRNRSTSIGG